MVLSLQIDGSASTKHPKTRENPHFFSYAFPHNKFIMVYFIAKRQNTPTSNIDIFF